MGLARRLTICLLLGGLTNLMIAFGLRTNQIGYLWVSLGLPGWPIGVITHHPSPVFIAAERRDGDWLWIFSRGDFGIQRVEIVDRAKVPRGGTSFLGRAAETKRVPRWARRPSDSRASFYVSTTGYGWPTVCLISARWPSTQTRWPNSGSGAGWTLPTLSFQQYRNSVAVVYEDAVEPFELGFYAHPYYAGLVCNTLFYASIYSLLLAAPHVFRRVVRRLGGRCALCAYDLRGDFAAGCPECGWQRKEEDAQQPA